MSKTGKLPEWIEENVEENGIDYCKAAKKDLQELWREKDERTLENPDVERFKKYMKKASQAAEIAKRSAAADYANRVGSISEDREDELLSVMNLSKMVEETSRNSRDLLDIVPPHKEEEIEKKIQQAAATSSLLGSLSERAREQPKDGDNPNYIR